MSEHEIEDERTTLAAMGIILAAGDARRLVMNAVDAMLPSAEGNAAELLEQASAKIREGHQAQTALIQGEAAGEAVPHSLLFTHAQDHLMNAMSEHALVSRLLPVWGELEARLSALEVERT